MFRPEDPLAPPAPAFDEPWQAQALALADTLVRSGRVPAARWAEALGAALAARAADPDTLATYYAAVLDALDTVTEETGIAPADRATRRAEWEEAYRATPHGQPVALGK